MIALICLLCIELPALAHEKNLKRPLETLELPAAKRIRLTSRVVQDSDAQTQKVFITLHPDLANSDEHMQDHSYPTLKNRSLLETEEHSTEGIYYLASISAIKKINETIDTLLNEIISGQKKLPCQCSVIHRMDYIISQYKDIIKKNPNLLEETLWHMVKKTAGHNVAKENLLAFLYCYLKNNIDLFSIKNNENKTLLAYAVKENCCSLTKTLLQFNSELALKLKSKVTLLTQDSLTELKESTENETIKNLLSANYVARPRIKAFLQRLDLVKPNLH